MSNPLPRKIWILWFQGIDDAPYLVKKCIDSWISKNPTWEINLLTDENLHQHVYIDLPQDKLAKLSLNHKANLVRLILLKEQGGVWADATTFCMVPLDNWIDNKTNSGFFVFHKPAKDRLLSNWFIASSANHPIINKLYDAHINYWMSSHFCVNSRWKCAIVSTLGALFNRSHRTTKYWFHPLITKCLRVYPYFVFHYLFERLISEDEECRRHWNEVTKISAGKAHLIQKLGFFSESTEKLAYEISQEFIPVLKLTWKYNHDLYVENCILHEVFERY